jgi:hypothetical protein
VPIAHGGGGDRPAFAESHEPGDRAGAAGLSASLPRMRARRRR